MSYQFIHFAENWGVVITSLDDAGRIRRCGTTQHPHSKNGSYFFDGERGWVQAWDGDCELHWWDNPNRQEPTIEEQIEWAKRRARREEEQRVLWSSAKRKATDLLASCKLQEHNYLHRKGFRDTKGLVTPDDELFIPMRSFTDGEICGGQLIYWKEAERVFEKKYLYGSQPKGAALRIGPDDAKELVLCEGYATGLSINLALSQMRLRASVLVCFNDSNLINIASYVKGMRSYVFADHDKSGAGESAAQATGLNYCMSPVEGEDANDMHTRTGLMSVCNLIFKARTLKHATA